MREGEVQDYLAFPRLAAQIDLMVAEPEDVVVQELGPFDRSIRTFVLHCATPVKIMDVTSPDEGNYYIGLMLWTVKRINEKS